MILNINDVMAYPEFKNFDEKVIQNKLEAIEVAIRNYTHNNFQNRNVRFVSTSVKNVLNNVSPFLKTGDTIQISESGVNDGIYTITDISDNKTTIDKELFDVEHNLVTKIEYPLDVQQGVLNLLKWDVQHKDKIGIKSETISRYSVTYFDQDSSNQVMGYPVSLTDFLKKYMKARF